MLWKKFVTGHQKTERSMVELINLLFAAMYLVSTGT